MKSYQKYKKSNIEWVNEIPTHWVSIQIKNLRNGSDTLFIDGDWIESDIITDDGIRYITTGNIGEGKYKEQGNGFISEVTFNEKKCTEVFPGDLLISRLNEPVGRACIIPDLGYRIITSVDNVILRPKAPFSKLYLMYVMNSPEYSNFVNLLARGTTMKRISRGQLGRIRIPVPPENEQKRIADYLNYFASILDGLIAEKENSILVLNDYRQSVISEVVTKGLDPNVPMKDSGEEWLGKIPLSWTHCKLKWISEIYAGGTPSTDNKNYWENGTVPWLNSGSVNQKRITSPSNFITEEALRQSSAKWIPKGSVLMALAGQGKTKGMVAVLDIDATCNQSMAAVVIKKRVIDSDFLFFWLHSNYLRIRGLAGSDIRDGLNLEIVGNIVCPLPPIEEQTKIAEVLNKMDKNIDSIISTVEDQIEKLNKYRQSLIHEAVTGKIDVRDWQPPLN